MTTGREEAEKKLDARVIGARAVACAGACSFHYLADPGPSQEADLRRAIQRHTIHASLVVMLERQQSGVVLLAGNPPPTSEPPKPRERPVDEPKPTTTGPALGDTMRKLSEIKTAVENAVGPPYRVLRNVHRDALEKALNEAWEAGYVKDEPLWPESDGPGFFIILRRRA